MKVTIESGAISGILTPPPSKSMTQRVYAAALLHKGTTLVYNAGNSNDENAALQVIQALGARVVKQTDGILEIESDGVHPIAQGIRCAESGLCARLFTPIAAISDHLLLIEGQETILKRPMEGFKDVLPSLNVQLPDFNGYLPFCVQGPMQAKSNKVDASDGSQFLSGLLFAYSACATEKATVQVTQLKSKPYIDLTLEVLDHFGKKITHNNYREFYIDPALFCEKGTVEINVEADWSSAAFFLVAGAIAGVITIRNLHASSSQADKVILDVLRSAGAEMSVDNDSISVKRANLQGFEFDATHCPDLFPILSILAACCMGESHIRGVHRLFHKESNRVESITEMLQDFAVPWSVEDDTLFISGVPYLQGTVVDSYHDHRIAMAAAIGALRANSRVDILHAESVNKSYPDFFRDLVLCGGNAILEF